MATAAQNQTGLVPVAENVKEIRAIMHAEANMKQILDALGRNKAWVDPAFMVRVAMTTVMSDPNGYLQQCLPVSILASTIQLAQVGLVPDGFLGQAYLIPRFNKHKKAYEARALIGYRGYGELVVRSGKANSMDAQAVYEGDDFDFMLGDQPYVRHRKWLRPTRDFPSRGNIYSAYAIVYMKEGPVRVELMPLDDIEKARNASESKDSDYSPWKKWFEEMVRKTPVRKLAKYVPLSPEFVMAGQIDELND